MKLRSNVIKGFLAFMLVLPLSPMANASCSTADAERLEKVAQAVVGALPTLNYSAVRRAKFKVTADESTGALNLKYSNLRRTLFEQSINIQELAPDVVPCCCVPSWHRTTQRGALAAFGTRELRIRQRCSQSRLLA